MTIIMHKNTWTPAMAVLIAYILLGFVIAYGVPTTNFRPLVMAIQIPIAEAIAMHSLDPYRVRVFWLLMIVMLPIFFVVFSVLAPLEMKKIDSKVGALIVLGVSFVFFGGIATPAALAFLFSSPRIQLAASKIDRLAMGMATDSWSLFYGGSFILVGLLILSWISYVAIPRAVLRIVRDKVRSQ